MIMKVFMFGNFGKMSELPKSGGQTSCRRVFKGLVDYGFDAEVIVRHRCELHGKILHLIEVLFFALIDLINIIKRLAFQKRSDTIFFQMTFSDTLAPYEYLITKVLHFMGFKCVIYLQGGQVLLYPKRSKLLKNIFIKTMDLQEMVLFEGQESLNLVKEVSRQEKLVYFPVYVFEKDIPASLSVRPNDRINLCYFGRIGPGKNTIVIIETFELLCKKYDNVYLTIIGGAGQSRKYVAQVDKMIEDSIYKNRITRKGLSSFLYINEMMQTQHFYLFPTAERCEGHSNALTECMSQGVVPIVSNYHFNASVVGENMLVVDGYSPQAYADRISNIIDNGLWKDFSEKMWNRVKDRYSYIKVNNYICEQLKNI